MHTGCDPVCCCKYNFFNKSFVHLWPLCSSHDYYIITKFLTFSSFIIRTWHYFDISPPWHGDPKKIRQISLKTKQWWIPWEKTNLTLVSINKPNSTLDGHILPIHNFYKVYWPGNRLLVILGTEHWSMQHQRAKLVP